MQYKILTIFVLLIGLFLFTPVGVNAKNIVKDNGVMYKFSGESGCGSGSNTILGDVNDDKSVAWLIQKILNYIKIIGPSIAVILSAIDFTKTIISSDDESMKKAQDRFVKRMIAAMLLFFVPLIVSILLGLFGFTSNDATCGLN